MKLSRFLLVLFLFLSAVGLTLGKSDEPSKESVRPVNSGESENPTSPPGKTKIATTPVPKEDWDWWKARHAEKVAEAKKRGVDIVLIGDSITHGWEIEFEGPGYGLGLTDEQKKNYREGAGKKVFAERLADKNVLNLGYGGDETQNVLWRLDNGEVDGITPRLAVLMIGINNIGVSKMNADETFAGIKAVVTKIREKLPTTRLVLMAVLPINKLDPETGIWQKTVVALNPKLKKFAADEKIDFLDIGPLLSDEKGLPRPELMADGVHPNAAGYRIWADALEPFFPKKTREGY